MTTTSLTPEQETVLQSFLLRQAQQWQQYQREYPELLALASYHIAPDGAWIAIEHEDKRFGPVHKPSGEIIRKSPACHTIVTKV